jgi:hypothetical protein
MSGCTTINKKEKILAEKVDPFIIESRKICRKTTITDASSNLLISGARKIDSIPLVRYFLAMPVTGIAIGLLPATLVLDIFGLRIKEYGYTFRIHPDYEIRVKKIVQKALPSDLEASLETNEDMEVILVVSAHLRERKWHIEKNPFDKSASIVDAYDTHEKLLQLSQHRSAQIIKSLVFNKELDDVYSEIPKLGVEIRHGVRTIRTTWSLDFYDSSQTIYKVIIPIQQIRLKGEDINDEDIKGMWITVINNIPNLFFKKSSF